MLKSWIPSLAVSALFLPKKKVIHTYRCLSLLKILGKRQTAFFPASVSVMMSTQKSFILMDMNLLRQIFLVTQMTCMIQPSILCRQKQVRLSMRFQAKSSILRSHYSYSFHPAMILLHLICVNKQGCPFWAALFVVLFYLSTFHYGLYTASTNYRIFTIFVTIPVKSPFPVIVT